jgi:hypothetical protein
MKTFIELDWLPMATLQAPSVHFRRQNRLYGRFCRSTEAGIQSNAVNLVRPKCS